MADAKTPDTKTPDEKKLTAADVAKRVKRRTVIEDKGAQQVKLSALRADEILDAKDYGTHIVAVTKDGQKFSSADSE